MTRFTTIAVSITSALVMSALATGNEPRPSHPRIACAGINLPPNPPNCTVGPNGHCQAVEPCEEVILSGWYSDCCYKNDLDQCNQFRGTYKCCNDTWQLLCKRVAPPDMSGKNCENGECQ